MIGRISFSTRFVKHYRKAPATVQAAFNRRARLFEREPLHPTLHNHALAGEWRGYRSINVTGDWRAVYESLGKTSVEWVEFVAIGTHSQLYG